MLTWILVACALGLGAHPLAVLVAIGLLLNPLLMLAALCCWVAVVAVSRRRTRPGPSEEAAFFLGLAAELRSGSSLRAALGPAASRAPELRLDRAVRLGSIGAPADAIVQELRGGLPTMGRLAAPAFCLAAETGATAARVFDAVAVRASEVAELRRESRALTAQARMSALVVGLAPVAFAGFLVAAGRGTTLLDAGPWGWTLAGVGILLEVSGLVAVYWLLRTVAR